MIFKKISIVLLILHHVITASVIIADITRGGFIGETDQKANYFNGQSFSSNFSELFNRITNLNKANSFSSNDLMKTNPSRPLCQQTTSPDEVMIFSIEYVSLKEASTD